MKKLSVILVLCAAPFLSGCALSRPSLPVNESSDVHSNLVQIESNQVDGITLTSTQWKFSFVLQKHFTVREQPVLNAQKYSLAFFSINPDTSEVNKRDTPNKFNTAIDNNFSLIVYTQPSGYSVTDIPTFKRWHESAVIGQTFVSDQQRTIGGKTVFYSLERDGVQSTGRYYYIVGDQYMYGFGTDDFTDNEMINFIEGFHVE